MVSRGRRIDRGRVSAYEIPTDAPEGDGTLEWDSTTIVVVELEAGEEIGIGYTYASAATARLIDERLLDEVRGCDALCTSGAWHKMTHAVRNEGHGGISAMAVSAVDTALWDLKAKLLGVSLADILGRVRDAIPIYGSGGFTTYSIERLKEQLGGWVEQGIPQVKMKVGAGIQEALVRVAAAREAVGPDARLFTDANSAFTRKEALQFMEGSVEHAVEWMEQPLPPEDLEGLRFLCDRAPSGVRIADGEYGYGLPYFRRMLDAGAVDVLMPDATRCGGVTGFMRAAALAEAFLVPISSHCAPLLHLHMGCAVAGMMHAEWFYDHVRIETMFFDGTPQPVDGVLKPDPHRPGLGVEFKQADANRYLVYGDRRPK